MYTPVDSKSGPVPAFLAKLWVLVEDPSNNDLICWDKNGTSFHIIDQGRLAKELLPFYFKHGNVASFIRQLNIYGFHKVTRIEQGTLKAEKDDMEFSHPFFMRENEHLLSHIKRKLTKNEETKSTQGEISVVLSEVEIMKQKQNSVSTKLQSLKQENTCLWREVAQLRQKHQQQQQIVSKLIQFLVSLVGTKRSMQASRKRNLPMIVTTDPLASSSKVPKYSGQLSIVSPETSRQCDYIADPTQVDTCPASSADSLTIHDITDEVTPSFMTSLGDTVTFDDSATQDIITMIPDVQSPPSTTDISTILSAATTPQTPPICEPDIGCATSTVLAVPTVSTDTTGGASTFASDDITSHIDTLQTELDGLKEYLSNRQYNFDTSALSELFSPEFPLTINSELPTDGSLKECALNLEETNNFGNHIVGNELIKYEDEPNLFESLLDLPLSPPVPSSTLNTPVIDAGYTCFPSTSQETMEDDPYSGMENVD